MPLRVAINGFGRIGRQVFRIVDDDPEVQVVAINDLGDPENLLYLLHHDSVYGPFGKEARLEDGYLVSSQGRSQLFSQKDPAQLPWSDLDVDVVIEATGFFTNREGASLHLEAGAKKVLISAPAKDPDLTIVLGVNEDQYDPAQHRLISNASCTTNCAAPVIKVIHEYFSIEKAWFTTVHSYTSTQNLVDGPHKKDFRRGRAAAHNIVPTTTGAAKAVVETLPELEGRLDGVAVRVPTICGSLVDLVAQVSRNTDAQEVLSVFNKAAEGKLKGILSVSDEALVSSDVVGTTYSAIIDASFVRVLDHRLIKVLAWYDNEWAYSRRLTDVCKLVGS